MQSGRSGQAGAELHLVLDQVLARSIHLGLGGAGGSHPGNLLLNVLEQDFLQFRPGLEGHGRYRVAVGRLVELRTETHVVGPSPLLADERNVAVGHDVIQEGEDHPGFGILARRRAELAVDVGQRGGDGRIALLQLHAAGKGFPQRMQGGLRGGFGDGQRGNVALHPGTHLRRIQVAAETEFRGAAEAAVEDGADTCRRDGVHRRRVGLRSPGIVGIEGFAEAVVELVAVALRLGKAFQRILLVLVQLGRRAEPGVGQLQAEGLEAVLRALSARVQGELGRLRGQVGLERHTQQLRVIALRGLVDLAEAQAAGDVASGVAVGRHVVLVEDAVAGGIA